MSTDAARSVRDNAALREPTIDELRHALQMALPGYQWSDVHLGRIAADLRRANRAALAAAPASPAGLDVEDLKARITTNFNVSQRRVERGIGSDFDRGKAAGLRLVLSMLEPRGEPTFSCGRPARLQSEAPAPEDV